jgi:hypothetical protein
MVLSRWVHDVLHTHQLAQATSQAAFADQACGNISSRSTSPSSAAWLTPRSGSWGKMGSNSDSTRGLAEFQVHGTWQVPGHRWLLPAGSLLISQDKTSQNATLGLNILVLHLDTICTFVGCTVLLMPHCFWTSSGDVHFRP